MGLSDATTPRLYATRGQVALALAMVSVLVLGGGFFPVTPEALVERWFGVAALLAVLAGATLALPERPWVLPAVLGTAMLGAGVLLTSCVTAEGLVVTAFGVVTAAQFGAFAFRARAAAALLAVALGVITAGMVLAPTPFHVMTWVVLVVMTTVSTSLLAYVTHWLRRHASTDDLTGALSRGALLQRLGDHVREAHRTGADLAVVSADVDDFKAVNDTRGHLAGDEALVGLVAAWRTGLGARACVGRVGGDEFVVVLPGRDRAAAEQWVAGARRRSPVPWSAGVAVLGPGDGTTDLLDRADVALYAAKAARAPRR